jgi:hypothetical protein
LNDFGKGQSKGWLTGHIFNNNYDHITYRADEVTVENHEIKVLEQTFPRKGGRHCEPHDKAIIHYKSYMNTGELV